MVYDAGSIHQKAIHSRIRKLIIYIGVIISFLVMLSSVKDKLPQIGYFSVFIKYGLIVLPIVVAAVMAYATQFTPSLAWGTYRVSAETIRREIYLYRMKAGDYATELEEKHSTMLLNKVNAVVNGVGVLGSLTAKYKVLGKDIPSIVKTKTDNPADDGFKELLSNEYVDYRVLKQSEWYIKRANEDYWMLRVWRALALFFAGVSSVLAALDLEPVIIMTSAATVALALYMELRMRGRTYRLYNETSDAVVQAVDEWKVKDLAQRDKPETTAELVLKIENLFERERADWKEQATQSQMAVEQALLKEGDKSRLDIQFNTNTVTEKVSKQDGDKKAERVQEEKSGTASVTMQNVTGAQGQIIKDMITGSLTPPKPDGAQEEGSPPPKADQKPEGAQEKGTPPPRGENGKDEVPDAAAKP